MNTKSSDASDKRDGQALVSIVIPAWNAAGYVGKCLSSVVDQRHKNLEVILIDNGSTDDTSHVAQSFGDLLPIQVVRLEKNRGFAGGANTGLDLATGKFVVMLNSDVELHPDFVTLGLAGFQQSDRVAAVGGTIYDLTATSRLETVQSRGSYLMPYASVRVYPAASLADGERMFAPASPACLLRRSALLQVRLGNGDFFDSQFSTYAEDIDLWLRLMMDGWQTVYVRDCKCWHRGSMAAGGAYRLWHKSPALLRVVVRNKYFFMLGTLPWPVLLLDLPFAVLMELMAAVMCVFANPRSLSAFILSKWDAARRLRYLRQKRADILGRATVGAWATYVCIMRERARAFGGFAR